MTLMARTGSRLTYTIFIAKAVLISSHSVPSALMYFLGYILQARELIYLQGIKLPVPDNERFSIFK
jgi:hypothetical protein